MPGFWDSNSATWLSNSLKAACVLPGISDTTLMWTIDDFLALAVAAEATPTGIATAIAATAAKVRFARTNDLVFLLNVISSPLLDPLGSVLQRLRLKRRIWFRLGWSVGFCLEKPDGGVVGHG